MKTLFKDLPNIVFKLFSVFKSGQTVGFYYFFSISKSYILFCLGLGSSIPILYYKSVNSKDFMIHKKILLSIFSSL